MVDTLRQEMEKGEAKDVRAANFLDNQIGRANWHQEVLRVEDWDKVAGAIAQTRPGQPQGLLDEAALAEYALMCDLGNVMPPLIAKKPKDDKGKAGRGWYPLDGFQRATIAERKGIETLVAYVVDVDDPRALFFISAGANDAINGRRNAPEDKLRQIEYALDHFPDLTGKDIARSLSVSETTVSGVRGVREVKERLNGLGVDYSKVENSALLALKPIQDDSVLERAVTDVAGKGTVPTDLVKEMVVAIAKNGRSEQDRLNNLDAFAKRPDIAAAVARAAAGASKGGVRHVRPYQERLLDAGLKFNGMLGKVPADEVDASLVDALTNIATQITGNLRLLEDRLPPAQEPPAAAA